MQGKIEPNKGNTDMSDRRANAMRKLERLRMRRAVMPRNEIRQRSPRIPIPPLPPAREVNLSTLTFLFEKRLKYSDVKDEGRIVVPKGFAEKFMPSLDSKDGLFIFMDDTTEVRVWRFRYRFWPNNTSRVYVLENTTDFVKSRGLRFGDFMMVYKDNETQRFAIGVRRGNVGGGSSMSNDDNDTVDVPPALTSNAMVWLVPSLPPNQFQEMQKESGPSLPTSTIADQEVAKSTSSYNDCLAGFPMHLLNMDDDIGDDLPEF